MPESPLHTAMREVERAIVVEGADALYHRLIYARHRREWPRLWQAIDKARKALHMENDPRTKSAQELYLRERRGGDPSWYNLPAPVRRQYLSRIAPDPELVDRKLVESIFRRVLDDIAVDSHVIDTLMNRIDLELEELKGQ